MSVRPAPVFHSDSNLVLGHVLAHSVEKTLDLVVTVESIWLLFLYRTNLLGSQDSEEAT